LGGPAGCQRYNCERNPRAQAEACATKDGLYMEFRICSETLGRRA
jgi:hypothetical protein